MLTNKFSFVNHESKMLGENNRLTKQIEQKRHHYLPPPPPLPPLLSAVTTTNRSKLAQGKKHRKYQRVISSCVSMIQLDSCVMNQALPHTPSSLSYTRTHMQITCTRYSFTLVYSHSRYANGK